MNHIITVIVMIIIDLVFCILENHSQEVGWGGGGNFTTTVSPCVQAQWFGVGGFVCESGGLHESKGETVGKNVEGMRKNYIGPDISGNVTPKI